MNIQAYHPFRSPEKKEQYLAYYDNKAQQWPVASETQVIDTHHGQTFIRISGSVDAPVLVLLPGASASSLMWESSIKILSKHYRVYAVDNIYDVGRSVFTKNMKNAKDFVAWLNELFTILELGNNINLMGLSYGAWLTAQYALNFPERLNKIVLLAPAATVLPIQWEFIRRVMLFMIPLRYFVKSMMYWLLKDAVQKNKTYQMKVDEYIDEIMISRQCFKLKAPVSPTVLKDKEFKNIKTPTLFLVGENEKLYSAQEAISRLGNIAPQIETDIISDSGHDLLFVQNELVVNKIIEFLKNPRSSIE